MGHRRKPVKFTDGNRQATGKMLARNAAYRRVLQAEAEAKSGMERLAAARLRLQYERLYGR